MLTTGSHLPDVTLTDVDGATLSLAGFRGKPVVVYFYPKADTPGCTSEALDFSALKADYDALGVAIIGVSKDTPAKLVKFAAKYDLRLFLASDGDGSVCEAFGTWILKKLYGREYMGIARATFLFDASGKLVQVWPAVKVKGHAAEVLEAAKAIA